MYVIDEYKIDKRNIYEEQHTECNDYDEKAVRMRSIKSCLSKIRLTRIRPMKISLIQK